MTTPHLMQAEILRNNSFQDIIDSAHLGYVDLSYHNHPEHITEVLEEVPKFCVWAIENGINDVPEEPLIATMSLHDYEIHVPLEVKRTATDEVHSALILGSRLIQFPEGREVLGLCVQGVIDTNPALVPRNNFGLAARRIDTANVCSDDIKTVLEKTLRVFTEEELELKSRQTGSYIEKRDKTTNFLSAFYFPGTVEFVSEDGHNVTYEPVSIGVENVKRLASMSEKEFIRLIPEAEDAFALIWPKKKIF